MRANHGLLVALVLATAAKHAAHAFYLPGVAPTDYSVGSPMNVKVRGTPPAPTPRASPPSLVS